MTLLESTVTLPDGRDLGFAQFGAPGARETILWLHGTPGARRQIPFDAREYAERAGVRIVGVDRPGVGWSSPHIHENVLGFARDLEALADHLGAESLHVVGLSGGGPYTLAAGAWMPDRVTSLGVIGGVAPTVGPDAVRGGFAALSRPFGPVARVAGRPLGRVLSTAIRLATPVAPQAIDAYRAVQPPGDRRLLGDEDFRTMFVDDLTNGARDQFSAIFADVVLFGRDWGFRLADVRQPVRWWHGNDDHIVPFKHGEHCVSRLPDAELIPLAGEAHLGGLSLAKDIVGGLVPGAEIVDEVLHADD